MKSVQELFNQLEERKREQKEIKTMYADALKNHPEHEKIKDEIKTLRERKKSIEVGVQADFRSEFDRLDGLKLEIEDSKMLMTDAAISQLMNGETVEVVDEKENKYEPVFGVRFKKI
jgi:DNA repair exonuclease SbcCD ATPase subunit